MLAHNSTQQWNTIDVGKAAETIAAIQDDVLHATIAPATAVAPLLSRTLRAIAATWTRSAAGTRGTSPFTNLHNVAAVLAAVSPQVETLTHLEAGWDSYDAETIAAEAILAAERLIHEVVTAHSWTPVEYLTPYVLPLADGGVQIEWTGPQGRLDVEVSPEEEVSFLLIQGEAGSETFEERDGVSPAEVVRTVGRIFHAA